MPMIRSLLPSLRPWRFGQNSSASWRADHEQLLPTSVKLFRRGNEYHLPLPGNHNLENLYAALCVCEHFGCEQSALATAVKNYKGVARRFSVTETKQNVHVVDDLRIIQQDRSCHERSTGPFQTHNCRIPTARVWSDSILKR